MNRLKVNIWGMIHMYCWSNFNAEFTILVLFTLRLVFFTADTQNVFMMAKVCTFLCFMVYSHFGFDSDTMTTPHRITSKLDAWARPICCRDDDDDVWCMFGETLTHTCIASGHSLMLLYFAMHFTLLAIIVARSQYRGRFTSSVQDTEETDE